MRTRLGVLATAAALLLGACGDSDTGFAFPTGTTSTTEAPGGAEAPGGTGTVPIPGPADWLRWSPAESPDPGSEAELVAALEELGLALVIPASPPPTGGTTGAVFNSQSLGYGSGQTFPATTSISLNVQVDRATIVLIRNSGGAISCPEGAETLDFRGDAGACLGGQSGYDVLWHEAGQSLEAVFLEGMTLDEGLAWVGTWRLLP